VVHEEGPGHLGCDLVDGRKDRQFLTLRVVEKKFVEILEPREDRRQVAAFFATW
jgi:hypothetical protein